MYHNHTEHINKLLAKKANIVPSALPMAVSTPTKAEYDALATAFNNLVAQLKDLKTNIS